MSQVSSSIASALQQKTVENTLVMPVPGSTNVGTVVVSSNLNGQLVNSPMSNVRPAIVANSPGALVTSAQQPQYVIRPEHQIRTQGFNGLPHTMVNTSIAPAGLSTAATAMGAVRSVATQLQIVNSSNASRFTQSAQLTAAKVLAPRIVPNPPIRIAPQQPVVIQRPQQPVVQRPQPTNIVSMNELIKLSG